MSARCVPEQPQLRTVTEREVWERLRDDAPDDWTILSNLRLTDANKDHEADLVVLIPDRGIVVIEVKGGSVSIDPAGSWLQSGRTTRVIRPVDQARASKYALRGYIETDPRWRDSSRTRLRYAHAVVLPRTTLADDFATPDAPRWLVHGRDDLATLTRRLDQALAQHCESGRPPTDEECDLVVEILQGRNLPQRDLLAAAQERAALADRLTLEQAALLQVTRLLRRVEVRGGAGSGKTTLAIAQARDLTRGRSDRPAQRVALVCYSLGLASYFARESAGLTRKQRPAFVGPFEQLARMLGVERFADRDDVDFWERRLPEEMAERAEHLPDGKKFDAVIVDEAQDFADSWWRPIMACLRDEDSGGLYLYTDENQRIFDRFGAPPVPLVPLVLDHNLRNTRQIADVFASLTPMRMTARGGEGPEVTFVASDPRGALDAADDEVEALLDAGWRPEDVALLTTGARHPEQVSLQEGRGHTGYWDSFWDAESVFYGHVLGCKGLERRAVVLCINELTRHDRSRERLYVGLSRATDRLVVVGDPDHIRQVGGPAVARQLGL